MFERFLAVERNDAPDIDLDLPDDRRDEAFGYLAERYGAAHVARLGLVQT